MREPWPEEATWTERLLLVASGEQPRTPEVDEALCRDPRVAELWRDLQALEQATSPVHLQPEPPRLAIARAREAFHAEARPGWLQRLRSAVLIPALAGVVALALGLREAAVPRPSWDGAHLEARLAVLAEDLSAWEEQLAPEREEWDAASPWDALESDLTRIEAALQRL